MPNLTEERMREILVNCYGKGAITIHKVADKFISHPEIKSLSEDEGKEVDKASVTFFKDWNFSMGQCPTCKHIECDARFGYCENCGQKLIWPTEATKENIA
jgi:hypothetical protein